MTQMMTLSGQLIFVLLLFIIYLLPRVYKNFLLTCAVYIALIVVDGDQYFKTCAPSDNNCKIINISFIIVFGIHVLFGILLLVGDIRVQILLFCSQQTILNFVFNRKIIHSCCHGCYGGVFLW